ncbi:MAG: hypothetical protein RLZZ253_1457 [Verrucomicrobiota bacterium]
MNGMNMRLHSLRDLYVQALRELEAAGRLLLRAYPRMVRAASHEDLVAALEEHRVQSEEQLERVGKILGRHLGRQTVPSGGSRCLGMAGLVAECEACLEADAGPEVLDAALVAVAQRIEHYEIAAYGTARTFAEILSEDEDARLLQLSLDEGIEADERLTEIAEDSVNADAEMAGED